jgi:hypothetical protein
VSDPSFAPHPKVLRGNYKFTESGWLWKLDVKVDETGRVILKDAAGLLIQSRGIIQVPNSPAVFKGATSNDADRTVEFLAITDGITMLDVTDPANPGRGVIISLQVEVKKTASGKLNFVAFDGDAVALNARGTPVPYSLKTTKQITGGPPESLFDAVPNGVKHVVISAHGQMHPTLADQRRGISKRFFELEIAGGVNIDIGVAGSGNCTAVFAKLKTKCAGGVIWIGGCEAAAEPDFCTAAAKASGCFVVASAITIPPVTIPAGMIELFPGNMIHFFNSDGNGQLKKAEFMAKAKDLKFHIVVA